MHKYFIFIFYLIVPAAMAQKNPIEKILFQNPTLFQKITNNPEKYRLQIIYTQINRDQHNKATFKTFEYRTKNNEYIYPASTVKLAASVLALEKLNDLNIKGLSAKTTLFTLKARESQIEVKQDTSATNGLPSIAHYIKKILLVSDNEAYNRLFEFLGQKELNQRMKELGFTNSRFVHRLQVSIPNSENKYANPIQFVGPNGSIIYQEAEKVNNSNLFPTLSILIGKGTMNSEGKILDQPLNFSEKNAFPIDEQHEFLKRLFFPNSFPLRHRFRLKSDDYPFLYKYMSMTPGESLNPNYSQDSTYYPSYCKFLYYGSEKKAKIDPNIRIFNKVGDAYGFLLDNAYFVDFKNKIEFMVSAAILCNEDEIFNDDIYEYDSIGFPFFKNLGQKIHEFELKRPKKYQPDLSHLKFNYEN